jgi:hypothetical protein
MNKPTTVAVTLDPESYAIFKEAMTLAESAGAKVTVGHLVQHYLQDEIRRQNPGRSHSVFSVRSFGRSRFPRVGKRLAEGLSKTVNPARLRNQKRRAPKLDSRP